jgi:malate dehydrogenase (oxaloacetate-decarboxylating)
MAKDYSQASLDLHSKHRGKIKVEPKFAVETQDDLATVYSPGVAAPCSEIAKDPELAYEYTNKGNLVAIVSDGSAVLGLGNIGALAAIPVMEGKAMLFKKFANIDAFPICLDTQDTDEIVATVKRIAPVFGGINLEDIAAPRSFEVEQRLQDLGIPVFHDDQHGTAIVVMAGLINACRATGKQLADLKVVINGAGAAGDAIARLLRCVNMEHLESCSPVADVVVCDTKGILYRGRPDQNSAKENLAGITNRANKSGSLRDALVGADVFIGVSVGNLLNEDDIRTMAPSPFVFALANPNPEIMPELATKGGASVVATGRSDMPNQINNVLGYPGIFRGALDARAKSITAGMKLAAAHAIASLVENPTTDYIIPAALDANVAVVVGKAVCAAALAEGA